MVPLDGWAGPDDGLGCYIAEESQRTLNAYRESPTLVVEHANLEQDMAQGGYQHRQVIELVQNAADALSPDAGGSAAGDTPRPTPGGPTPPAGPGAAKSAAGDKPRRPAGDRIEVCLNDDFLYCADNGAPIDRDGVRALMFSRMTPKRGTDQIGTFGLGFKAVLGVSDAPEFFSRSGSFRFDGARARQRIRGVVSGAERCPVLRLPDPTRPAEYRAGDDVLEELMDWAVNIVRLPLKEGVREDLRAQLLDFPAEFLLFVPHVNNLVLTDRSLGLNRVLELKEVDGEYLLADGELTDRWMLFKRTHDLSGDARTDRRPGDDRDEVPIWWAAPLDRLDRLEDFWAYFPTETASLVAGILNAPWKTNEDRQNLLPGPYNDELIGAAAEMIADEMPRLSTADDPARHLDALPRRREASDKAQANLLRKHLFSVLHERAILPDQDGELRTREELRYPPLELTRAGVEAAAFERWEDHPGRPRGWLHHGALNRNRVATVDRLFHPAGEPSGAEGAPRASVAEWLEALVRDAVPGDEVQASMAAIQTAALVSPDRRAGIDLGEIVLTETGDWRQPDPENLFLPFGSPTVESIEVLGDGELDLVHPELASDWRTLRALRTLGLAEPSSESRFRLLARRLLGRDQNSVANDDREGFWLASRELSAEAASDVVREQTRWQKNLRVRTQEGTWKSLHAVLLLGPIVPGDGSRDSAATVDMAFHGPDRDLLRSLGATDSPQDGRDLSSEPAYRSYRNECEDEYRMRTDLPHIPGYGMLSFTSTKGVGPVEVLTVLSDDGKALYTDALLRRDASYDRWEIWHTGTNRGLYPKMPVDSLPIHMIREHGRIRTSGGVVPFGDALGPDPANSAALYSLLQHPRADKIRETFDLADPRPEFFGEYDPVPLTDEWPGMLSHLRDHEREYELIRCERISVAGGNLQCILHESRVYLIESVDDDEWALQLIGGELGLNLGPRQIEEILQLRTPEIEQARGDVARQSTKAARLLAAVDEEALRDGLPRSLLGVIENDGNPLTGLEIAEAAIDTYHTDALWKYRKGLGHLRPPTNWAGSAKAVTFVRSLGFSAEWAGERSTRRAPFEEVEGPRSLPDLHPYQRRVADSLRAMLRRETAADGERRGMISMPTGSGKTRVAVQAIVEAIRDGDLRGGVLWVADRDELCEQAVEAWRQVWASLGTEARRLRISRVWSGQPEPRPLSEFHVVVATIQTLRSRLGREEYEFLKDFELVIVDEAHRSISPTYTSVLGEIGLTYRRPGDEPFLLGLTATPYRGHDAEETARLVRRYGRNRLDAGAFRSDDPEDVIAELQAMDVVARADHEIIEGGTFRLNSEDLEAIDRFTHGSDTSENPWAWLPQAVEIRIANDPARTARIVEAYEAHIQSDWPTLVFATSVEHARTVAALLNRDGIAARSVTGETKVATRRRAVEEFRDGDVKALVNYGVFREGFDAPKTRAIVVARPVYSPNLYFQMIGRGLRGTKNGGGERCLILDVKDNIENFGGQLAFGDLDWLWVDDQSE